MNETYPRLPTVAASGDFADLIDLGGGDRRQPPCIGVRRLMLALLEDAIRAYLGPSPEGQVDAELWITTSRKGWIFSFTTVCETLGLEPTSVRAALRRMRARRTAPTFGPSRNRSNGRRRAGLRAELARDWAVAPVSD
ncbi:MAG: hypothetical protein ACRERC_11110 [Candidatus Binatia bacterium]